MSPESVKNAEALGSHGRGWAEVDSSSHCCLCLRFSAPLACFSHCRRQTIPPGGPPDSSSHTYVALCFSFSGPSSFIGCRALIFFTISPAASSQSWLLLPEGIVLNMQHHASASFSPSLIMILSIFPVKGHLSRCLHFFINVCEGKSSLIIMKTIAETPLGEGSSRLCRRFNFRDPLIGKIA